MLKITSHRIVIPKEIRTTMNLDIGDSIEFFADHETGFLGMHKYVGASCKLCNSAENLTYFRGSLLCKNCTVELKGNIGVSPKPIPVVKEHTCTEKRTYQSSQNEYAKWLGVSQSHVSQLKGLL
ncbi:AbrB/MazE/SpoVT family DNA-binding domain-containing protein [Paenibacillus sp. NRS-1782]|uniref:AbrB/MazE/SpoVT family DNA-binding domain-containing protein n=1 Tax=unclassified Paenibacillus TaxID=185978 RepID=UPI003D275B1D